MKNAVILLIALTLILGVTEIVKADPITFTGSSGTLEASVTFATSGNDLIVTLTNTSIYDVLVPSDILSAVFFNISGNPSLTRTSAVLAPGSSVFYDPDGQPAGGIVGGEWAYKNGLVGAPLGATQGISSSGFGLFGPGDRFPGNDLAPPDSPDGINYGILSAGDNTATGNAGVVDKGGEIKNSVLFTLSGIPAGFDPSKSITNVSFQYGTGLDEPNVTVPEPGILILLGIAMSAIGMASWRIRKI